MKITITTYMFMILIALTNILSGSYIAMQLQIVAARNYNSAVVDRIQASNFSPNIITEISTKSTTDGFPTKITDVTLYQDKRDVLVKTSYKVSYPFFGIVKDGVIESYAR